MKKLLIPRFQFFYLLIKIDISNQEELEEYALMWKEKVPNAEIYPVSALKDFQIKEVFNRILELLPQSPPFYPKDQTYR